MAENKRVSMSFFSAPLLITGDEAYLKWNKKLLHSIWLHFSLVWISDTSSPWFSVRAFLPLPQPPNNMGSVPCCRVGDTDGTTNWLNEMGLDVATMMRLGAFFFEEIGELW